MFPAWAGMNRVHGGAGRHIGGVPRVGGDEPIQGMTATCTMSVFPAWAGMNRYTIAT